MWRLASLVALVVACDHRPAPRRDRVAAIIADAAPTPAGPDACLQIGARIAEIIISTTTDPTQRAAYEQDRTKLVKRFSDDCTTENWRDATRGCFLAAKTPAEIEACSKDLASAQPPPAASPTGIH